jgi:hypothetical protein
MLKICKTYDKDIAKHFKIDEKGMYYNNRLEIETNKRKAYSDSRRENRKNKKPTHDKDMKNTCNSYDKHMENENEIENENEVVIEEMDYSKTFAEFMEAYPVKTKPRQAERFWSTLVLTKELFDKIMAGVENWKKSDSWQKGFIQDPVNWLKDGQYEAEPKAHTNQKQNFEGHEYSKELMDSLEIDPEEYLKILKSDRPKIAEREKSKTDKLEKEFNEIERLKSCAVRKLQEGT